MHFENNNKFFTRTRLERIIEISQWSNITILRFVVSDVVLETFLSYFGERWGADRERLGRKKKCLQLYSTGIYTHTHTHIYIYIYIYIYICLILGQIERSKNEYS